MRKPVVVNMPDGSRVVDETLTSRRDRLSIPDLVSRCCHKLTLPASAVWEMSLADIVLSVRNPDQEKEDDPTVLTAKAVEIDRRRELLARMSVAERVALEQMKADLM